MPRDKLNQNITIIEIIQKKAAGEEKNKIRRVKQKIDKEMTDLHPIVSIIIQNINNINNPNKGKD